MSRERIDKAVKKAKNVNEMWNPAMNKETKFIRVNCELCNREIVINNYPDRQPRVKRFMGVQHCPWCPKDYKKLVRAIKFLNWAAKQPCLLDEIDCKCPSCKARELLGRDEVQVSD